MRDTLAYIVLMILCAVILIAVLILAVADWVVR